MVIKKCIICGKEFDAVRSAITCSKECSKERRKQKMKQWESQYYQDEDNKNRRRQQKKQYQKQYRQKNKEHLQQYHKQYWKQYKQKNKEYLQQYSKQYYQDNKEYYQERNKRHYQNNKEYYQQYSTQYVKKQVNELVEQYDGDLEEILENVPTGWHLREAQMRVWFNESYHDGMMAKRKSTLYCEVTGEKDNLVIHHLWSFNLHPELGADPANMVRITEDIHNAFHKEHGYGNNTPEQWEEFVNNYLHNSANSNQSSNSLTE